MPAFLPCRHLFTDGHQCGSPALRGEPLCFHHHAGRRPLPLRKLDGATVPQLPAPDDFYAIQRGIGEVLRLLANDEITDRRASTLLRGLAHAGQNLARAYRRETTHPSTPVTDLVVHPTLGTLALEAQPSTKVQDLDRTFVMPGAPPSPTVPSSDKVGSPEPNALLELPAHSPFPESPEPELDPVPTPTHNFTPHPTFTAADEARVGELYLALETAAAERRAQFEAAKTAELHAHFQDLHDAFLDECDTRYTQRLAAALAQTHNPAHPPTQPPDLDHTQSPVQTPAQAQYQYQAQAPDPVRTPPQQNQEFTPFQQHETNLAPAPC